MVGDCNVHGNSCYIDRDGQYTESGKGIPRPNQINVLSIPSRLGLKNRVDEREYELEDLVLEL